MLKYYPEAFCQSSGSESFEAESTSSCRLQRIGVNLWSLEQLILKHSGVDVDDR